MSTADQRVDNQLYDLRQFNDNADKTGLLVTLTLPDGNAVVLDESEGDNWSIAIGGKLIKLDIPVENRDAKSIAAAVLKLVKR